MKPSIHILHLEDDPYDAALVQATLREGGIVSTITRVETQEYYVAWLDQGGVDLILADFTLPAFDGMSALKLARQSRPDWPFIFVSGTLGEDQAIESLKNGATDYVLKRNLSRLPMAIKHAMQDVAAREERRQFEGRASLRKKLIIPPQKTTSKLPRLASGGSSDQRAS
jgi:DNA-binding NtrC family response regulator